MLKIYKTDIDGKLINEGVIRPNSLIVMIDPNEDQIQHITRDFNLPRGFFTDALDEDERPRLERDEHGTLIILNLPVKNPKAGELHEPPYITQPLGIIHTENNIFLISRNNHAVIDQLLTANYGEFQTHMKSRITLLLFKAVAQQYDDHLAMINEESKEIQQSLRKSYQNKELFALISLNKSLVFFSISLSALAILYRQIIQGRAVKIHDDEKKLLENILVDIEQSAEVAEMRRESLSNLMDAYAAIVHNNLNTVLKALTAIAIIMIIPTMIGSIFSMNVDLPNEHDPMTTVIVGSVIVLSCFVLLVVFYLKKYIRVK